MAATADLAEFILKLVLSWILVIYGLVRLWNIRDEGWGDALLAAIALGFSFILFESIELFEIADTGIGLVAMMRFVQFAAMLAIAFVLLLGGFYCVFRVIGQRWREQVINLVAVGTSLLLFDVLRGFTL